jgi:hypothetical protein
MVRFAADCGVDTSGKSDAYRQHRSACAARAESRQRHSIHPDIAGADFRVTNAFAAFSINFDSSGKSAAHWHHRETRRRAAGCHSGLSGRLEKSLTRRANHRDTYIIEDFKKPARRNPQRALCFGTSPNGRRRARQDTTPSHASSTRVAVRSFAVDHPASISISRHARTCRQAARSLSARLAALSMRIGFAPETIASDRDLPRVQFTGLENSR